MAISFINSFQSEWLKKKRSLVSWMVIIGAFFTPLIILASRLKNYDKMAGLNRMDDFWIKLWNQSWESMAVFFLPMGVILATALITQIEYKNNAWKQLHTTPQRFGTIYFAKLAVILIMMTGLFVLFNIGMYLSGVLPSVFIGSIPYPDAQIPFEYFLRQNVNFFIDTLPILALQYLISLQYKNFLVPVGVGFLIWTLSIGMTSWHYSYVFPYIFSALDHFIKAGHMADRGVNLQLLAIGYFIVFTIAGYILYVTKSEKG